MDTATVRRRAAAALCLLLCMACCLFAMAETSLAQTGILNAPQVNLRVAPHRGSASLGRYDKNQEVLVEEAVTVGDTAWYQVRIGDKVGYILAELIDLPENPEAAFTPAPENPAAMYTVPPQLAGRSFRQGDHHAAILQIKEKMQELGYYRADAALTDGYNDTMAERIRQFQENNGLPQTGKIDEDFLTALYGPLPVAAPETAPSSTAAPKKDTRSSGQSGAASAPSRSGSSSASPYVGNRSTRKFHHAWCASVKKMNDSNKVPLDSRDEAIRNGYQPCKNCKP